MSGKNIITVERLSDGRVVQVMPDGSKRLLQDQTDWARLRAMTESEIEAVAVADLDNPPLTDEELKKFRRVPNLKEIRQKLHMTQEQFAMKFHVPLGTLRDSVWAFSWNSALKRLIFVFVFFTFFQQDERSGAKDKLSHLSFSSPCGEKVVEDCDTLG